MVKEEKQDPENCAQSLPLVRAVDNHDYLKTDEPGGKFGATLDLARHLCN